jgi:hypothetical protein
VMSSARSGLVVAVLAAMAGVLCTPATAAPSVGIEIGNPEHKILGGPDEDGDLEISVKISIRNTAEPDLTVQVFVQALDKDGFEVFDILLSDIVKGGQTRTLSDWQYIKQGVYRSIQAWRVEEVTVRPGSPGPASQPAEGRRSS